MKKLKAFNIDAFKDNLDKEDIKNKELDDLAAKAYEIISTISDYIDCEAEYIMSLNEDEVMKAISIICNETGEHGGFHELRGMVASSRLRTTMSTMKSKKKASQNDLF